MALEERFNYGGQTLTSRAERANPELPVSVFVVSLARATDRWARIQASLVDLGQPWERVNAYDAEADRAAVLEIRGLKTANNGEHPFQCEPKLVGGQSYAVSEEACFQSHLAALRNYLINGEPYGLILEDDALLPANLFAPDGPVAHCIAAAKDWDIVRLEATKHFGERMGFVYSRRGEERLIASLMPSSGAAAYLVSRRGARQLIRIGASQIEPFDTFLVDVGKHRMRLLDYSPYPIRQMDAPSFNAVVPKGRALKDRLVRILPRLRRHATRLAVLTLRGTVDRKPLRKCRWRN